METGPFDAVFLDAGGVLVTPDPTRVAAALATSGLRTGPEDLLHAHYQGMYATDRARSDPEHFEDYFDGYLTALGLNRDDRSDAVASATAALASEWAAGGLWIHPVPGARKGLELLRAAGLPVVIVSNADGTVADLLAKSGLVQAGPGPGFEVEAIIDSGVVGVAKPDPRIFALALEVVGVAPERVLHIGDAYSYDVVGARAAGIHPVMVDPLSLRPDLDCPRIASLAEIRALMEGTDRPAM